MVVTVISCINKASRAPALALDPPFLAYGVGNSSTSRLVRALSRCHCISLPRYCNGIVVVRDEADRSNNQLVEETESRRYALKNTFAAASCHRVFVLLFLPVFYTFVQDVQRTASQRKREGAARALFLHVDNAN
jgi:hypothetical protein